MLELENAYKGAYPNISSMAQKKRKKHLKRKKQRKERKISVKSKKIKRAFIPADTFKKDLKNTEISSKYVFKTVTKRKKVKGKFKDVPVMTRKKIKGKRKYKLVEKKAKVFNTENIERKHNLTKVVEISNRKIIKSEVGLLEIRFRFWKSKKTRLDRTGRSNKRNLSNARQLKAGFNQCYQRAMAQINFSPMKVQILRVNYIYYIKKEDYAKGREIPKSFMKKPKRTPVKIQK